jgi:hypothetical protein
LLCVLYPIKYVDVLSQKKLPDLEIIRRDPVASEDDDEKQTPPRGLQV